MIDVVVLRLVYAWGGSMTSTNKGTSHIEWEEQILVFARHRLFSKIDNSYFLYHPLGCPASRMRKVLFKSFCC